MILTSVGGIERTYYVASGFLPFFRGKHRNPRILASCGRFSVYIEHRFHVALRSSTHIDAISAMDNTTVNIVKQTPKNTHTVPARPPLVME
jgi:hypothetical protein